jgi:hypothetical protein
MEDDASGKTHVNMRWPPAGPELRLALAVSKHVRLDTV